MAQIQANAKLNGTSDLRTEEHIIVKPLQFKRRLKAKGDVPVNKLRGAITRPGLTGQQ